MLADAVDDLFKRRGWVSLSEASRSTRVPVSTLKRFRDGAANMRSDTAEEFAKAVGEDINKWKRLVAGIDKDDAEGSEGDYTPEPITRVPDLSHITGIEYYSDFDEYHRSEADEEIALILQRTLRRQQRLESIGGRTAGQSGNEKK